MDNGKIVGLVGSFEDVTSEVRLRNDVVELNCKLQTALEKERQANQAKSDFLLHMSHDMRTPLTTIIGYSDLELKKRLKPELVRVFSTIKTCSNFLLGILSDILDLQKLMTHGSPQMTQRYAHLADEAMKRAASVIDECLDLAANAEPARPAGAKVTKFKKD